MATTFEDGSQFGDYQIISTIGSGGFATVYHAENTKPAMRRKVALKVLHEQLAADEAFRERFFRESLLAVDLDHHPNIVPVHDAGEIDGHFFIAMRYVEGIDLKEKLADGPLEPAEASGVIAQVASALDLAHRAGLVHRDVKPGNVLLPGGSTDHVYLADFGLTKETAAEQSLTQVGQFLGTLYYAAPEQIEGKDLDGRTDQYALGCMLYECLTGEPPFKGEMQAIIGAHLTREPPKASDAVPGLPAAIDEVITRAMAKAPADRYESCGELGSEAFRALRDPSPNATVVTGPLPVTPAPGVPSTPPPPPDPNATIIGQTPPPGGIPATTPPPPPGIPFTPPPPPGVPSTPPPPPGGQTPGRAPAAASAGESGLNKKVGGLPVWALGAGGLVVVLLLVFVVIAVAGGGGDDPGPDPTIPDPTSTSPDPTNEVFDPGAEPALSQADLDELETSCSNGTLLDCDFLFFEAGAGSDQEAFGASCGDTFEGANGTCGTTADSGSTISDLVDFCLDDDNAACDELFFVTPVGSRLEAIGTNCGGRGADEAGSCVVNLG